MVSSSVLLLSRNTQAQYASRRRTGACIQQVVTIRVVYGVGLLRGARLVLFL